MIESNTCSDRSQPSGDAPSRDAVDRTWQKGCAAATTNSRGARDRCDRCLRDVEVTLRAISRAAEMLPSTRGFVRLTPIKERRASPYVPSGPFTVCRVPADSMAASNPVRLEDIAQGMPLSTMVVARWLHCSSLRWDATSLAARNAISHLGTAKDTGVSYATGDRLHPFAIGRDGM